LHHNSFEMIPTVVSKLADIEELDLQECKLTSLQVKKKKTVLIPDLTLFLCAQPHVIMAISQMPKLRVVNVRYKTKECIPT